MQLSQTAHTPGSVFGTVKDSSFKVSIFRVSVWKEKEGNDLQGQETGKQNFSLSMKRLGEINY